MLYVKMESQLILANCLTDVQVLEEIVQRHTHVNVKNIFDQVSKQQTAGLQRIVRR